SLKTSIKTITYLSDTGCLEIQGASLVALIGESIRRPVYPYFLYNYHLAGLHNEMPYQLIIQSSY
ncbi:hypothetical protein OSK46_25165, partial [Escherichia coli]|nr:hypothetical protein [Escherichia coli]